MADSTTFSPDQRQRDIDKDLVEQEKQIKAMLEGLALMESAANMFNEVSQTTQKSEMVQRTPESSTFSARVRGDVSQFERQSKEEQVEEIEDKLEKDEVDETFIMRASSMGSKLQHAIVKEEEKIDLGGSKYSKYSLIPSELLNSIQ